MKGNDANVGEYDYVFKSDKDSKYRYRLVEIKFDEKKGFSGHANDILDKQTGELITKFYGEASCKYLGERDDLVTAILDGRYSAPYDLKTGEFVKGIDLDDYAYSQEHITDCAVSADGKKCLLTVERYSSGHDTYYVDHYYEIELETRKVVTQRGDYLKNYENCMNYGYKEEAEALNDEKVSEILKEIYTKLTGESPESMSNDQLKAYLATRLGIKSEAPEESKQPNNND